MKLAAETPKNPLNVSRQSVLLESHSGCFKISDGLARSKGDPQWRAEQNACPFQIAAEQLFVVTAVCTEDPRLLRDTVRAFQQSCFGQFLVQPPEVKPRAQNLGSRAQALRTAEKVDCGASSQDDARSFRGRRCERKSRCCGVESPKLQQSLSASQRRSSRMLKHFILPKSLSALIPLRSRRCSSGRPRSRFADQPSTSQIAIQACRRSPTGQGPMSRVEPSTSSQEL